MFPLKTSLRTQSLPGTRSQWPKVRYQNSSCLELCLLCRFSGWTCIQKGACQGCWSGERGRWKNHVGEMGGLRGFYGYFPIPLGFFWPCNSVLLPHISFQLSALKENQGSTLSGKMTSPVASSLVSKQRILRGVRGSNRQNSWNLPNLHPKSNTGMVQSATATAQEPLRGNYCPFASFIHLWNDGIPWKPGWKGINIPLWALPPHGYLQ